MLIILLFFLKHEFAYETRNFHLDRIQKHLNKADEQKLNLLANIYFYLDISEKAEYYYKQANQLKNSYKYQINLATLYSKKSYFTKSISLYEEVLKSSQITDELALANIMYNYCYTLILQGDYQKSNKVCDDLTKLYLKIIDQSSGNQYILRELGDHYQYHVHDYENAIFYYEKSIEGMDYSVELLEIIKQLINTLSKLIIDTAGFRNKNIEELIFKRNKYVETAFNLIPEYSLFENVDLVLIEIYSNNYESAKNRLEHNFTITEKLNLGQHTDFNVLLALCNFKLGNYKVANSIFERITKFSNSSFLLNHYAQSLRLSGDLISAEIMVEKALINYAFNINTLIAQIYINLDLAENFSKTNEIKSEKYFLKTISISEELNEMKNVRRYSRILNAFEKIELMYQVGYSYVGLANIKNTEYKTFYLKKALGYFENIKKILEGNDNENIYYFKSLRALEEIKNKKNKVKNNLNSKKLFFNSGIIFTILAVYIFVFGRPIIEIGYKIDILLLSKNLNIPASMIPKELKNKKFSSKDEMENYVYEYYNERIKEKQINVRPSNKYLKIKSKPINAEKEIIILLFSASFLFIVLGILLDQIKTLSVGSISIEKKLESDLHLETELKLLR